MFSYVQKTVLETFSVMFSLYLVLTGLLVLPQLSNIHVQISCKPVKIYNKINYAILISHICDLVFVHFCLYFVSKFYFSHLFNSCISTSKILDISFFFFTLLCFRVAIQSYLWSVYHIAGRAACGPWCLHIPASRLEEQNPGANPFNPFSCRIS